MAAQYLQIIIMAGVAFLIISKLISVLGQVNENDHLKSKNFSKNKNHIKDVTPLNDTQTESSYQYNDHYKYFTNESIAKSEQFIDLVDNFRSFEPAKFLKGSEKFASFAINGLKNNDFSKIINFIDPRYLNQFKKMSSHYISLPMKFELKCLINDIYSFGNTQYIKTTFTFLNHSQELTKEEWTFSKSRSKGADNSWNLCNIEINL